MSGWVGNLQSLKGVGGWEILNPYKEWVGGNLQSLKEVGKP